MSSEACTRQIDIEATEKLYNLQKARDTEQYIRDIKSGASLDNQTIVEKAKSTVSNISLDKANQKRHRSKRQALNKMLELLSANPTMSPPEIADLIGKSRQTVYGYFDELEATGKLHRNGSINVIN